MNEPADQNGPDDARDMPIGNSAWRRLKQRWPEFLLEMVSVLVGLSLAFSLEQWRDDQARMAQAGALRSAVLGELRSNAQELSDSKSAFDANLQRLVDADTDQRLHVTVELALLSDAAFNLLQSSAESSSLDLEWRLQVAKVYELQALVEQRQLHAIDRISVGSPTSEAPLQQRELARSFLTEFRMLQQFRENLAGSYATLLAQEAAH